MLKNLGKRLEKSAKYDPMVIVVQESDLALRVTCRYGPYLFGQFDGDMATVDEGIQKLLEQIDSFCDEEGNMQAPANRQQPGQADDA